MNKRILAELDYYTIRAQIAGCCISSEGAQALMEREPLTDKTEIGAFKNISRDWQTFLDENGSIPISRWENVKEIFGLLKIHGATLSIEQAHTLLMFCTSAKNTVAAIKNGAAKIDIRHLAKAIEDAPDISHELSSISRVVTNECEMRDLPELREIRGRIISLEKKIDAIMRSYISDVRYSRLLESNVPALRGGHQTLAVNISQKNSIPGIIHEVSQSGKTAYIEPSESVLANNELMQEEANLQRAIFEILKNLTEELSKSVHNLEIIFPIMVMLDMTQAAAQWGRERKCVYAVSCDDTADDTSDDTSMANCLPAISLVQARHPLLKSPVPIDVQMESGKRILVITGANAGGKTVALKTVALFALLNQSGFPVPATEGTVLPIFDNVFADIGDGQSLDSALSTFSSHIKNCADALKNATSQSLVLLDELGSGTDPLEGSAISLAILDELAESGAIVLVTTHQGAIKNYAWTHDFCANASVEFDAKTLSPLYKIAMGIPGESRALDIAEKNGLTENVIERARSYIAGKEADISALIKKISEQSVILQNKTLETEQLQQQLRQKEERLYEREKKIREKEYVLKSDAHIESKQFLIDARSRLENLVREIREGEITREKTLAVKNFIADLSTNIDENETSLESEKAQIDASLDAEKYAKPFDTQNKFREGVEVITKKMRRSGTIISKSGKHKWLVQFGSVKIEMKESDLEVAIIHKQTKPTVTIQTADSISDEKPKFELRLLGLHAEDATKVLQHQLDLCVMHDFKHFSVIHGKGHGVLQQAVQDYLSHYVGVKEFHFAPPEDGGTGKTYVTMM